MTVNKLVFICILCLFTSLARSETLPVGVHGVIPKETIRHCDAEPCEAEAIQNDYKISIKAWIASACFASSQPSQRRYMNFEIPREHLPLPFSIHQSIQKGQQLLQKKVIENKYYLQCVSSDNQFPCPINNEGKIVTSYYIVNAIQPIDNKMKATFIALISNESRNNRWGYSIDSPPDVDDTSFALQTLHLLGKEINMSGLMTFYHPKINAFSTFITDDNAQPVKLTNANNNLGIHEDTNANVYHLFQLVRHDNKINDALIKQFQNNNGSWSGYFYGMYYSTYMNLKLLCVRQPSAKEVRFGLDFILKAQNKNGSWGDKGNPYDTALAVNTLLACEKTNTAIKKGIAYLLATQHTDGSWSYANNIWRFTLHDYPSVIWFAYDNQQVLTTALAITALKQYVKQSIGRVS